MADISELQVQITLTVGELRQLVALANLGNESLPEGERFEIADEVGGLYFELMELVNAGESIGDFLPQQ